MPVFNLRIKVLIPVAVMILASIFGALIIVNQVVRRQVLASVAGNLNTSRRLFQELQGREWQLLLERGLLASTAPQLKAAVDTGDSTTVQHVTNEIFETVNSDLLIITDQNGQFIVQHGLSGDGRSFHLDSLRVYKEKAEGQIGLLGLDDAVYRVASVAIVALDVAGMYELGRMILGNRIDTEYLRGLRDLVDCEIAFRVRGSFGLNNLDMSTYRELVDALSVSNQDSSSFQVVIGEEEFLAVRAGLRGDFVLFKSVDRAFQLIYRPIEITMLLVAGLAIIAAILISGFISQKIVNPVAKLVRATDAITAGDYETPVETKSNDEIGHLAKRFDEMRRTLQHKMTQLGGRNVELEEALKKLETTQEQLLRSEKLAATGKITAQLSHELNNPIHNIQSCLEAAQKRLDKGESGGQFIHLAYDEVLRMGKLTRQMLDFHRPQVVDKQKTDVHKIIRDVLESSEGQLEEAGIQVVSRLNSYVREISTSPDQIKQVFLNLVLNAVDAMPGGGTLAVGSAVENSTLSIHFEDSGCGIPAENLNKIFDAFFTTKDKASGVGLGLTVSYGIVRSLGGNIVIDTKVNRGSIFTVKLPLDNHP